MTTAHIRVDTQQGSRTASAHAAPLPSLPPPRDEWTQGLAELARAVEEAATARVALLAHDSAKSAQPHLQRAILLVVAAAFVVGAWVSGMCALAVALTSRWGALPACITIALVHVTAAVVTVVWSRRHTAPVPTSAEVA